MSQILAQISTTVVFVPPCLNCGALSENKNKLVKDRW